MLLKITTGRATTNIAFKSFVNLTYENFSNNNKIALYKFNGEKWNFENQIYKNKISAKLFTGGIYTVLSEEESPIIKNVFPANDSKYKSKDIQEILFNCFAPRSWLCHSCQWLCDNGRATDTDHGAANGETIHR